LFGQRRRQAGRVAVETAAQPCILCDFAELAEKSNGWMVAVLIAGILCYFTGLLPEARTVRRLILLTLLWGLRAAYVLWVLSVYLEYLHRLNRLHWAPCWTLLSFASVAAGWASAYNVH
jgi:hypothetical protein